ncbi:MAG TPA: hypothetical protein VND88_00960 [Candidatus Acidoferrales bacterium]|nr:hypothetical protein [Candidatus Acidoferrales bacterium]
MNPLVIAAVWVVLGVTASAVLRRRTARLVTFVPLAGAGLTLLASRSLAPVEPLGGLGAISGLDRAGQGLLVAAAISMALVIALHPSIDVSAARTIGVVGASVTLAMASGDPLLTALALTVAVGALALRWIGQAPGRATLAAGRIAGSGTAALIAASPFLPLSGFTTGARPVVVGGLLVAGVAALLAVYPLGGWAAGVLSVLRPLDVAPWLVLLVPTVLLLAERIPEGVLGDGVPVYEHILLVVGLGSAVWGGFWAVRGPARTRYGRIFMTDIALSIAAVGGTRTSPAVTGALIIVLCHLTLAPILLRPAEAGLMWPRRVAWALLSGVPPSPSFWGRFLLLEALAAGSVDSTIAAVVAMTGIFIATVMACSTRPARVPPAGWRARAPEAGAWLLVAAGIAIGLAPLSVSRFVFGS